MSQSLKLVGADVSDPVRNLFRAGNHQSLSALDGLDKKSRLEQRIVCSGVEPRHASAHHLNLEIAGFEIKPVQVGDLQFAALRGPERSRKVCDMSVVEIEPGDGIARF